MIDKCQRCDGCGRIASGDEGAPWTMWESLPPGHDIAVRTGLVKPIPCPDCGGLLQDQKAVEILKFLLEVGYTKEQVVSGLKELEARTNEHQ